ncbi:MAG TPA: branched-chain amino acid ABC transporter ATP-binding protein/permease [Trebonia sp.]|jgi:ABC-type branched-subunit amino acid transport system ATPase component/ABC-type branched-subunit amino acid transport system permease subunit|nr:branched-chain amino acid ABC transporter ATP-binding protein/permease [Trebonia sp.]
MSQYLVGLATTGVIFSVIALALNVRWGWAGEFDIALFAFVAIGAYVYSVVTLPPSNLPPPGGYILGLRWTFLLGVVAAVVVAGLLSAIAGAVALRRLRDDYFGITTLAITLILALVIGTYTPLFDGYEGLYGMPQPLSSVGAMGPDGGNYLLICVAALIVTYLVLERLGKSPFGRTVKSVREDDTASAAFGRNVYLVKLKAYILGGCVAGLGGALLAAYITAFNPYGWTPTETFLIYAAIFIGGTGNSLGVIIGAFFVEVGVQEVTRYIPQIGNNASSGDAIRLVVIGLLIVAILWFRPQGILPERRARDRLAAAGAGAGLLAVPGWAARIAAPWSRQAPPSAAPASESSAAKSATEQAEVPAQAMALTFRSPHLVGAAAEAGQAGQAAADPVALRVSNVVRAFGGVRAVDGASFEVRRGSLTGLIGPNGAGKSTMINLISGFDAPDSGVIEFDGKRIDGKPAHAVARLGLMRSFQTPREWGGLTVMDNMLLSAPVEGRDAIWRGLLTARRLRAAENADRVRARELLDAVGLLKLKDEPAGNLSGGQKRLLEFARLAAASPRLVLLDEPQAGVNPVLRERMGDLILAMVEADITVLMVEHNLPFLERLCGHVIVMALGQTIASGSMAELRANRDVVDAYLGQEHAADV